MKSRKKLTEKNQKMIKIIELLQERSSVIKEKLDEFMFENERLSALLELAKEKEE